MTTNLPLPAVPLDVALQVCVRIRADNRRKLCSLVSRLWCRGCVIYAGGMPEKMRGGVAAYPSVVKWYAASQ